MTIPEEFWEGLTRREQIIFTQMFTAVKGLAKNDAEFAWDIVKSARKTLDACEPLPSTDERSTLD